MRTISVAVSEADYEAFRAYAARHDRSIAELVREAMAFYRAQKLSPIDRLDRLPILRDMEPTGEIPSRVEIMDEMTERHG